MKGLFLCAAIVLGITVSNITVGQEPTVIDGSVVDGTPAAVSSCDTCETPTLIGMSQHAVKQAVGRGRCVAQHTVGHLRHTTKAIWSKRPHLRRCKCC